VIKNLSGLRGFFVGGIEVIQIAKEEFLRVLKKLEGKGRGMRPCPEWNSNKGICNLDSKTCMVSQYDWQNCPKGE
jgi:hypothetical protein